MDCLYQCFWHSSVYRQDGQFITAQTMYADSDSELAVNLLVSTDKLEIQDAYLETYGSPGDTGEQRQTIDSLKGVQAYLGQGKALQGAIKGLGEEMARSLINETVISIVQAETFLLLERGYADKEDYNRAWKHFYAGKCRYYSNQERISLSWMDYIGDKGRGNRLFDRFKSQHLYRDDSGAFLITGNLRDSFHHMSSWLEVEDREYRVKRAEGKLLQVPDNVCRESAAGLQSLCGRVLPGMSKHELADHMWAGQGCVHLIDLVYDSAETLQRYLTQIDLLRK